MCLNDVPSWKGKGRMERGKLLRKFCFVFPQECEEKTGSVGRTLDIRKFPALEPKGAKLVPQECGGWDIQDTV